MSTFSSSDLVAPGIVTSRQGCRGAYSVLPTFQKNDVFERCNILNLKGGIENLGINYIFDYVKSITVM